MELEHPETIGVYKHQIIFGLCFKHMNLRGKEVSREVSCDPAG
jgi:hypothetical protein